MAANNSGNQRCYIPVLVPVPMGGPDRVVEFHRQDDKGMMVERRVLCKGDGEKSERAIL